MSERENVNEISENQIIKNLYIFFIDLDTFGRLLLLNRYYLDNVL